MEKIRPSTARSYISRILNIANPSRHARAEITNHPLVKKAHEQKIVRPASIFEKVVEKAIKVGKSNEPIVIGPWMSEVGYEVLYWIPMLRFMKEVGGWKPENTYVLTRGGAHVWYNDIAKNHGDIFSIVPVDEFKAINETRWASNGGSQKQKVDADVDKLILSKFLEKEGLSQPTLVHPSFMYRYLKHFWKGQMGLNWLKQMTRFSPYNRVQTGEHLDIPKEYFVTKFYFNASFPDTAENREFCRMCLDFLSQIKPVVLLSTNMNIDDHGEFTTGKSDRIFPIDLSKWPITNLAVQTEIVAGSSGFFGTYGGFAYLPMHFNVPSTSFCSNPEKSMNLHLTAATQAALNLKMDHGFERAQFNLLETTQALDFLKSMKMKAN